MASDKIEQSGSWKSLLAGRRVGPRWIGGEDIELRPAASALQQTTSPGRALDVQGCSGSESSVSIICVDVQVQAESLSWLEMKIDFSFLLFCSMNASSRAPSIVFKNT
jgi:hypothetical protein